MKTIYSFIIERLKLNDKSKVKKEDIIRAFKQNSVLFKYCNVRIKCGPLWSINPRIEILKTLEKIIDNTDECLDGCYLFFFTGTKQYGFHVYDSSYDDKKIIGDNYKSRIGTIRMYNIKKDEECNGEDVEFDRENEDPTTSQLNIIKQLEAYIQPLNTPFRKNI